MRDGLQSVGRIVGGGVRFLALAGGIVLLWVMGLTVVAVVMRKVFGSPIGGVQDLSEASLLLVVFCGLAYAGWTGAHIAVDLISAVLRGHALASIDTLIRLCSAALLVVVAWQSARQGFDTLAYGDAFNMLPIPHYPFYFFVAFGSALYGLVLFVQALRAACGLPDIKSL